LLETKCTSAQTRVPTVQSSLRDSQSYATQTRR